MTLVPAALAGSGLCAMVLSVADASRENHEPKGPLTNHDREPNGVGLFLGGLLSIAVGLLWTVGVVFG